jgi:hypothetical protein
VPIVQKGSAFVPELLFQVAKRAFLGVRYRGVRVETALNGSPPALIEPLLGQTITVTSSGVGPVAVFDTRDNEMNPASGVLIAFRGNFAEEALGSDFNYRTFTLAANYYRRAGPGVLALRGYACGVPTCAATRPGDTATARCSRCRGNTAFRSAAASARSLSPGAVK